MYLEKISQPSDVKQLSIDELKALAQEVRNGILNRVSNVGGHVGPNLGITEVTIALSYVFNQPDDKIVYDVSHQYYPHKMLTGRAFGYTDNSRFLEISGYSSPAESPVYDNFEVGHTSTSITLASGLQKARDLRGEHHNVIAVIGDGSLSGGQAFEGFDTVAELGTNMIVVVNDNEMSIAENHGGLYKNLAELRATGGNAKTNFFTAMGMDYVYVEQGNDVVALIDAFSKVKDIDHPIVVHVHTEKGHGYKPAVDNKESWHWHMPFDTATGELKNKGGQGEDYIANFRQYLLNKIESDPLMTVVTSGVPGTFGFDALARKQAGRQYVDVGIAEEAGVSLASGMAKGGAHPVYITYATFLQRTYDQITQDLCVNGNPAVINVLGGSIFGMNDITHICFFDIPMLSHIPNLVYLAPTNQEEFVAMNDWAIAQDKYSVAIRVPVGKVRHASSPVDTDYSDLNKYKVVKRGSKVAILGLGNFMANAERIAESLQAQGVYATVINPRFVSGVDADLLNSLQADHQLVVTLEDGSVDGGFGERIARYYAATDTKVLVRGVEKALYDRYDANKLMVDNRLTDEQVVADIISIVK